MDFFSDVKMLVLLLACLSSTCGRPAGLPNQGYKNNAQQQPSSLDGILKAVLVHESTGNGVQSGSVASNTGHNFKVTKHVGQRPSTGYTYSAKTGLQNIRVFHKSHGDTGYTRPHVAREAPRGFSSYATPKVDPDQALKSIHESLFRHRSDQKYGQGQTLFGSSAFGTSNPREGYRYESPKQSRYFYEPPRHTENGFGGYQYSNPSQALMSAGFATENLSSASGYPSNQYSSPVQNQKANFATEDLSNTRSPFTQSNTVHSVNEGSDFKSSNSGSSYQFSTNNRGLSSSGQQVLSSSEDSKAANGYQYHAPKPEGYRYEKPVSMGYTYEKPAIADHVAISQLVSSLAQLNSENQGYRYEKPIPAQSIVPQGTYQHGNTAIDGNQYSAPSQSIVAPNPFEQPSNTGYNFNTPLQVDVAPYQMDQSSNSGYNFNDFVHNFDGSHNSEQPQSYQTDGYHYHQPNKPDSTKSVFKGPPYLPQPSPAKDSSYQYESSTQTNGYRYDIPDESSRPQTVFKGLPYLPPVSGGL